MNQQLNLIKVKNLCYFPDEEFVHERSLQSEIIVEASEFDFCVKSKSTRLSNVGLSFIILNILLLYVYNVAADETFGEMLGDLSIFDMNYSASVIPNPKNISNLLKIMNENNEKIERLRQSLQKFEEYLKEFIKHFMTDQY